MKRSRPASGSGAENAAAASSDPNERAHLRSLLRRVGLRADTNLGQHFLADERPLRALCQAAELGPDCDVVEVGAGIGNLSSMLALSGARVTSLEVDRRFEPLHRELHLSAAAAGRQLEFRLMDALKFDFAAATEAARAAGRRLCVVGNIPYQITSPLVMGVLESGAWPRMNGMTFMMQREVAERLLARPGSRTIGSISYKVQAAASVRRVMEVPASSFLPPPKVESSIVHFSPHPLPGGLDADPVRRADFFKLIDAGFTHRRKQLANSLAACGYGGGRPKSDFEAALAASGLDPQSRAEQLSLEDYLRVHVALANLPPDRGADGGATKQGA